MRRKDTGGGFQTRVGVSVHGTLRQGVTEETTIRDGQDHVIGVVRL